MLSSCFVDPALTSLRPKDEGPNFLNGVIFWESSHKEKGLEGGALKAEIPEFRACIIYLFLSLLRVTVTETTKASAEHPAAFTDSVL